MVGCRRCCRRLVEEKGLWIEVEGYACWLWWLLRVRWQNVVFVVREDLRLVLRVLVWVVMALNVVVFLLVNPAVRTIEGVGVLDAWVEHEQRAVPDRHGTDHDTSPALAYLLEISAPVGRRLVMLRRMGLDLV